MNRFKAHICSLFAERTGLELSDVVKMVEVPPEDGMGDYGIPCFQLAKTMRMAPPKIAAELQTKFEPDEFIESVVAVGPYLNFYLSKKSVQQYVCNEVLSDPEAYGSSDEGSGKTVVLEYSSPNIAKPMGIGHLRSTIIGASLDRIYKKLGYNVVSINHIGDWGTQFGKLALAYQRWADKEAMAKEPVKELYRIYVKLHQEAENDSSLEDESREMFKKLENGDPDVKKLWQEFVELSWRDFQRIYDLLGVKFDSIAGESTYQDRTEEITRMLKDKGLTQESQGALIVPLDDYKLEPLLLRKKDGSTLYSTRDLAAAIYRFEKYHFDKLIYVVGVAQSLHFRQFFKTLELAGYDWVNRCEHIDFGWVKIGDEMMSTRRGNIVILDDVLQTAREKALQIVKQNASELEDIEATAASVGIGAVIFSQLGVKRQTDVSFDWDRMLDFQGYSGPYLQYGHARLCSVFRKHGKEANPDADFSALSLPEEYKLARMLLDYPDILSKAAEYNEPYIVSNYLFDLVSLFSTYFQKYKSPSDKILSDNQTLRDAKIGLAYSIKTVLKSGLELLGLDAVEKM